MRYAIALSFIFSAAYGAMVTLDLGAQSNTEHFSEIVGATFGMYLVTLVIALIIWACCLPYKRQRAQQIFQIQALLAGVLGVLMTIVHFTLPA
jgi:hypothetical protein